LKAGLSAFWCSCFVFFDKKIKKQENWRAKKKLNKSLTLKQYVNLPNKIKLAKVIKFWQSFVNQTLR